MQCQAQHHRDEHLQLERLVINLPRFAIPIICGLRGSLRRPSSFLLLSTLLVPGALLANLLRTVRPPLRPQLGPSCGHLESDVGREYGICCADHGHQEQIERAVCAHG